MDQTSSKLHSKLIQAKTLVIQISKLGELERKCVLLSCPPGVWRGAGTNKPIQISDSADKFAQV